MRANMKAVVFLLCGILFSICLSSCKSRKSADASAKDYAVRYGANTWVFFLHGDKTCVVSCNNLRPMQDRDANNEKFVYYTGESSDQKLRYCHWPKGMTKRPEGLNCQKYDDLNSESQIGVYCLNRTDAIQIFNDVYADPLRDMGVGDATRADRAKQGLRTPATKFDEEDVTQDPGIREFYLKFVQNRGRECIGFNRELENQMVMRWSAAVRKIKNGGQNGSADDARKNQEAREAERRISEEVSKLTAEISNLQKQSTSKDKEIESLTRELTDKRDTALRLADSMGLDVTIKDKLSQAIGQANEALGVANVSAAQVNGGWLTLIWDPNNSQQSSWINAGDVAGIGTRLGLNRIAHSYSDPTVDSRGLRGEADKYGLPCILLQDARGGVIGGRKVNSVNDILGYLISIK